MATESRKVIIAALLGNSAIAVTKFIAAGITASSAMFAEAIHSVVDTGNQVLLLFGLHRAKKPASPQFPFGHGKEVYFWSFVVAILIFAVGAGISIYEGVHHVLHPVPVTSPHINYIVLGLAMVFEAGAWYVAWKGFNETRGKRGFFEAVRLGKDPTMFVVLFEDSAAMLGLITAFIGVYLADTTGMFWLDGAASIVIGIILALTAVWLAMESKSLLIGESALPEVVDGVRDIVGSRDEVLHVNEVLTLHMGPSNVLVNISANFAAGIPSQDLEACIADITDELKKRFPTVTRVFIETERRPRNA